MWCAAHLMMCTRNNKKRSLRLAVIARRKMSESRKRENLSLETRKLMRESKLGAKNNFYGRHHTNETKKKISLSHLGKPGYWKDRHLSIETKRKLSKAKLGKPIPKLRGIIRTQEYCQKMMYAQNTRKKIVQMDDNDTIIQKFESIREAERKTKISRRCISWCLNGEQKHAGGFVWKYER
jgi:group I intron endonuclease